MNPETLKALSAPTVYPDRIATARAQRSQCAMCATPTAPDPTGRGGRVLCGVCQESHYIDGHGRLTEREGEGGEWDGWIEEAA